MNNPNLPGKLMATPGVRWSALLDVLRSISIFMPKDRSGSAWPRWTVGIDIGNWGLGAIGENWGLRIMLIRVHVCFHYKQWRVASTSNSELTHRREKPMI